MDYYLFSTLVFFFLLLLITKLLFNNKNCKKKYPPSPLALPIIGHLHLFKKPLHHALACLSDRHGPITLLRFGSRPVLVVSSASVARECLTDANDVVFADRPQFPSSKHMSYNFSTIGSSNYGPHWRNLRRIATIELLSSHRLASFSHLRATQVHSMIRRLFQESSSRDGYSSFTRVELKSRIFEYAMNHMMRMIAGDRWCLYGEDATRFKETVEEAFKLSGASNIGDFLPVLGWMDLQGLKKKVSKLVEFRDHFYEGLIEEHKVKMKEGVIEETMITHLLALQETDPDYYTDHIIKGLVNDMLFAGTDTSSDTIEWAVTLLLNNPDKLKKAQAEIDGLIENKRLLQESDLANLPYLQYVITETLRLYPAGPLLVPHESSKECVVGGYDIPKGTMLLVNAYSIQRDTKTWIDATKFEPERFQDAKEEGSRMFPFGMGRRRCPGEGLANRVVGLVLGMMIQCFDWERVGKVSVDMTEGSGLTLPKAIPLEAIYRPRETMVQVLSDL